MVKFRVKITQGIGRTKKRVFLKRRGRIFEGTKKEASSNVRSLRKDFAGSGLRPIAVKVKPRMGKKTRRRR